MMLKCSLTLSRQPALISACRATCQSHLQVQLAAGAFSLHASQTKKLSVWQIARPTSDRRTSCTLIRLQLLAAACASHEEQDRRTWAQVAARFCHTQPRCSSCSVEEARERAARQRQRVPGTPRRSRPALSRSLRQGLQEPQGQPKLLLWSHPCRGLLPEERLMAEGCGGPSGTGRGSRQEQARGACIADFLGLSDAK